MPSLSQGTSFSFGNSSYTVTRVAVNLQWDGNNRPKISTAHLGSSIDDEEPYVFGFKPPADESASTVEVDFLGGSAISVGATGAISIAGGFSKSFAAATCVSSVSTASTGDLVRGSAVFKVKAT